MHYLACDLGAESGRLMLGTLADGRLSLEELHRFPMARSKPSMVCAGISRVCFPN